MALLTRIGVIAATPDFAPIFDAADFHRHAISIADGEGYPSPQLAQGPSAFRPPLYPLALASVQVLGGGLTAERLLGALLGVVTVLLVFEIARRLWGRRVAVVAGLIAAVFPSLIVLNASLLSEVLFLPLALGALLAVLRFREDQGLRWVALAGALCGLAALTRGNGLLLVLAVALGAWIRRPRFSRAAIVAPALAVLVTLVVIAPWAARNAIVFDRFVGLSTQTGYALAGTYSEDARQLARHPGEPRAAHQLPTFEPVFQQTDLDEAERMSRLNDEAMSYIRAHPFYVVQTIAWNVPRVLDIERRLSFKIGFQAQSLQANGVGRLASPLVLVCLYAVIALALVGVAAQAGMLASARAPAFVWAVPVLLILPALAIFGLARYRAAIDPFLVMLAAVGLVAAFDRLTGRAQPPAARGG